MTRSKIAGWLSFFANIGVAVVLAYLLKTQFHLCDPATVYVGFAMFGLLAISIPRLMFLTHPKRDVRITKFAIESVMMLASTGLILFVCSTGYTLIAWVLVIALLMFGLLIGLIELGL